MNSAPTLQGCLIKNASRFAPYFGVSTRSLMDRMADWCRVPLNLAQSQPRPRCHGDCYDAMGECARLLVLSPRECDAIAERVHELRDY